MTEIAGLRPRFIKANMDTFTCTVDLNGEHLMVLSKKGVGPAELIMLRRSNGPHNVTEIIKDGTSNISAENERLRLEQQYGKEMVHKYFGPYGDIPMNIEDAKIPAVQFKEVPKKAAKPKAKKAAPVKEEPKSEE